MKEKFELFSPEGSNQIFRISSYGNIKNVKTGNFLEAVNDRGYRIFSAKVGGKRKQFYLANVMAHLFLPASTRKQVIHKNGDKSNCHIANIMWADAKHYAQKNKLRWRKNPNMGKKNRGAPSRFNSKITDDQIRKIRVMEGTDFELSLALKIPQYVISNIRKGKTFRWVV